MSSTPQSRDPGAVPLGTVLGGRYRLEAKLGEGAFGTVYRAISLQTSEAVAVKVMARRALNRAGGVARFRREAELLSRLRHPNSVRCLGSGEEADGCLFIAFELLVGRSLEAALATGGAMPWGRAAALICEALLALEEAHSLGLVHRDLKPANLFLLAGDKLKVIDFGLAKSTNPGTLADLTRPGSTLGSPLYMAPERIAAQPVTGRSDLFALGIVLAEMVHGAALFGGMSAMHLMTDRLAGKPIQLPPELDGTPLREIVERATRPDPSHRFASATEMREALIRALRATSFVDAPTAMASAPASFASKPTAMALPNPIATKSTLMAPWIQRPAVPSPAAGRPPVALMRRSSRWRLLGAGACILVALTALSVVVAARRHTRVAPPSSGKAPEAAAPPSVTATPRRGHRSTVDYFADATPIFKALRTLPRDAQVSQLIVSPNWATAFVHDPLQPGTATAYRIDDEGVMTKGESIEKPMGRIEINAALLAVIPRVAKDALARLPANSHATVDTMVFVCEGCTLPRYRLAVSARGSSGLVVLSYSVDGTFTELK